MNWDHRINATLADIFGFRSFRANQEEIVRAILRGQDVFAVMPTGGGKSLCYQLPARLLDGVCVVVSPLISLMKDQVDAAVSNGLRAATLNSTTSAPQNAQTGASLRRGEMDLLYISPERFNSERFIERLKTLKIAFFAIDEAHCISEWGHDFRADYLALSRIVQEFPEVPLAAFTATATNRVAEDILDRLQLRTPLVIRASFNRPNLFYQVELKRDINRQLIDFLQTRPGESGIIYRLSRKNVDSTAEILQSHGFSVLPYHAGMSDRDRERTQEAFQRDQCAIIVATIAFGMGIDKSNVRFVVHADLPKNLEGYYQETGRAGRDGDPAHCVLYLGRQDAVVRSKMIDEIEEEHARSTAKEQLREMLRFADSNGCRRSALLRYFGEIFPASNCGGCDRCVSVEEREDATIPAQKALSAIVRTGERFGAGHIVDVLVGANTEKIRLFRHEQLPTYGVGKEQSKSYWKNVIEALLSQGMVYAEDPIKPVLKISSDGWRILKKERTFLMFKQEDAQKPVKKRLDLSGVGSSATGNELFSDGLFQQLREIRTELARLGNVPPYIIFSDRTLHDIARRFPTNREEFLQVGGVGQHKADAYGERFLEGVNQYVREHPDEITELRKGLEESRNNPAPVLKPLPTKDATEFATKNMLEQGKTLDEIAEERNLKRGTIITHLERLRESGYELDSSQFFVPQRLRQLERWFHESGGWMLKPALDKAEGQTDYEELRLARLFLHPGATGERVIE